MEITIGRALEVIFQFGYTSKYIKSPKKKPFIIEEI